MIIDIAKIKETAEYHRGIATGIMYALEDVIKQIALQEEVDKGDIENELEEVKNECEAPL